MVVTREPGGTATGEKIRRLLLDTATAGLSPMAELALMFASRAQHITEVIQPALAEGRVVLCDRFTDSTEAYQGGGRKLGSEPVLALHRILCHGLQPDLTILMDSDVAASVERARRRNKADAAKNGRAQTRREPLRTGESRFFRPGCATPIWLSQLANRSESCWSMRAERRRKPTRGSWRLCGAS